MKIDDSFRVISGGNCLILQELTEREVPKRGNKSRPDLKPGDKYMGWSDIGYYHNLETLTKRVVDMELQKSIELESLMEKVEKLKADLAELRRVSFKEFQLEK